MAIATRDPATARARAQEALDLYRALRDARGTARSIYMLGLAIRDEGDFVAAKQLFEESSRALLELDDEHAGLATFNLAWMCAEVGDLERAQALHEENLRRARAAGDRAIEAVSLDSLAYYAGEAGRVDDALSMVKESLRIHRDLGDVMKTGDSLGNVAKVLEAAGSFSIAARLIAASDRLYEETGIDAPFWVIERNEEACEAIRAHLDSAAFTEAWEEGRKLTLDEAVALALDMRASMRNDLPTGTVTFLFTDVEGSTKLLHELGAEALRRGAGRASPCHPRGVRAPTAASRSIRRATRSSSRFPRRRARSRPQRR